MYLYDKLQNMKNKNFTLLLLFVCASFLTPIWAQNTQNEGYVPGDILVQVLHNKDFNDLKKDLGQVAPGFKLQKRISKGLNAYKIHFDPSLMPQEQALEKMWAIPYVIAVQNNHYVKERMTTPNDLQYAAQWHHHNDGSTGTADADIDTDEAWDITTGGLTDFGDTIVVCILEGSGGDLNHEDLSANAWFNYAEDPNNGIDDDGNGYVDDFRGWNVSNSNDNIGAGNHGTAVAGMVGAEGDNNLGVTGVNWNVKLMMVSGFSVSTESSVLAAYDYPLTMRQMYNNSNGTEGAYVVVTNASWGIDGGQPSDAPLWCNMYDTLGYYGILSCGATANNDVNIDQVGDLPTACPSEYLISVTATDVNDERTFSGYGPVNIDIGAPGDQVYLPENTNSYDATSGTSFASPLTAGVIALLYSAPCASFAQTALDDPALAAEMIRDYIFDGVDPSSYLVGEVATEGRINANNSLQLLLNDCSSGCVKPYSTSISGITDIEATLNWNGQATQGYVVEIREASSPTWMSANTLNTSLLVDTLAACTEYEVRFKALCDAGAESDFTDTLTFTTDGCCENPTSLNATAAENTISVSWPSVLAAQSYDIRYKMTSSSVWSEELSVTAPYVISGLEPCTEYEIEIRTVCATQTLLYDQNITISTKGCGACLDMTYCPVDIGDVQYEWLDSLVIGSYISHSGNNGGYQDFSTNNGIILEQEVAYNVTLKPGYSGFNYTENFRLYIDLNQNGTFEANEKLLTANDNNMVTGSITIPETALLGLTKMRVFMADQNALDSPCIDEEYYGEIEDYCVEIKENTTGLPEENSEQSLNIFPNPSSGSIHFNVTQKGSIQIYAPSGQMVSSFAVQKGTNTYDIHTLSDGVYVVYFTDKENNIKAIKKLVKN